MDVVAVEELINLTCGLVHRQRQSVGDILKSIVYSNYSSLNLVLHKKTLNLFSKRIWINKTTSSKDNKISRCYSFT